MEKKCFYSPMDLGFSADLLERFHAFFLAKKTTLAVAESCTAGMLSASIVNQSGASEYYKGGIVCYSNDVKESLLDVPHEILLNNGAVSVECAEAMAKGVRSLLRVDCALAITGIAGPSGGSKEKPVGTVCIGVALPQNCYAKSFVFDGDRTSIRFTSVYKALELLLVEVC